jgi:hypothetical protein
MPENRDTRWLLLIHQIPPKPDYFRVKIWRRLQRVGAVAIKNSVYVLPKSDQTLEDFQWIIREITEGGGDASLCEAGFVEGLSDGQIEALFRAARDADYAAIADEARELRKKHHPRRAEDARSELETDASRLRKRLAEVAALDFFDSLGRQTAEGLVSSLEARVRPADNVEPHDSVRDLADYRKRVWVTRKGIHIDRMGSAWLIRRFIDSDAKFKFVPARGYRPEKGKIRFDMFDAEFTHEGDRCTFEVLIARLVSNVGALRAIAEIIHDIDLKDSKFERTEAAGIDALITGICTHYKDDDERLQRGSAIFDDLFESFSRRRR